MSQVMRNTEKQKKAQETSLSLWQIAWKQFLKHPMARAGMWILGVLYLMALLAGFLAPYRPDDYDSGANRVTWVPPAKIHIVDENGKLTRPFVYSLKRETNLETFREEYTEDKTQKNEILFFVRRPDATYKILGLFKSDLHLFGVTGDQKIYLWGSDNLGRDQFSRIMYGSVISLTIGILATIFSVLLGLIMGGIAGYFGGWVDTVIMRFVEVLAAIPTLFLLFTLRALFPIEMDPLFILYVIVAILAFVGWGSIARAVRSQLFRTRELDYVQAAVSLGAGSTRIIGRHMLPDTLSYTIVIISLLIPGFILEESGLSFLGIGVVEPYSSWGSLLKLAQDGGFESITGRPWTLIPGVFILLAITAWQFVGDGLRDAFDPRKRH
ncbi:ABC transporter permease [Deinococcus cellulosilyticus]|uniref:Peptide ABC transporter permease n=1 Tax=Deinococcus cellulosilyticus (strain DSM 18568 / NBRC 106333 / KACC 11606 / 5516J-15) TaxID=1223518 RepID=A0A511NAT8_DEIC1|nr:ABC transporter permease [Deinococcus cellulosilyticus]GEM49945.1 peptide ABC transporter permease [Deinococcus cellulosilyticus NBRC 106333 = KACC 11606]